MVLIKLHRFDLLKPDTAIKQQLNGLCRVVFYGVG